jgi:hypothetical protein
MEQQQQLVNGINDMLQIELAATTSFDELRAQLAAYIRHLIDVDFEKLVYYLYRIDVHEDKMRALLSNTNGNDTADIIAALIIERQQQKIQSRQLFTTPDIACDEERW